ncbi:MAG TPA: hypothetical protein VFI03_05215 [Solirubrobacterales bacterium]|nr:hypothetical protein [Solirubrobacterales bacterium]
MEPAGSDIGGGGAAAEPRSWARANAPVLVLGLVVVAASALLLKLAAGLTFYQDSWAFLMHRQGLSADAFLQPHNEHIVLIAVAIQKVLLAIFGMSSAAPEFVVMTAFLAATAVLLFVYVRRRLGPWPAVFAATLLLFVGPAWQVLLWPFEIVFVGSLTSGIAMLLALDRGDRRGDVAACVLLAISLGFSSLGLSFAVAAVVDVALGLHRRGFLRAYVFLLPLLLFAVWYLGWGSSAENHVTAQNILDSPGYMLEGIAVSLANLLGLGSAGIDGPPSLRWGWALSVLGALLFVWALVRRHRFSARVLPVAAATASFWVLTASNYTVGREATLSRYAYAGGVFTLLLAADLLRGVRFGRVALWAAAVVTAAAAIANLQPLQEGRDFFREQAVITKADLGAMEIAQRTIDPGFELTPEIAGTPSLIDVFAHEYFPVEREYGSPAYSPRALLTAPPLGRRQADVVLVYALPVELEIERETALPPGSGPCTAIAPGSAPRAVRLGPGVARVAVAPGPDAALGLRRFAAGEYPINNRGIPGGSVVALRIPPDRSQQPWLLRIEARQGARVCAPSL